MIFSSDIPDQAVDDLLLVLWENLQPYVIPFIIVALLIAFRLKCAEIAAEVTFVFRHRLAKLENRTMKRRIDQSRLENAWQEINAWQASLRDLQCGLQSGTGNPLEVYAEAYDGLRDVADTLASIRPFVDTRLSECVDKLYKECQREAGIWFSASEKREAFLDDCAKALNGINKKINDDLCPCIRSVLQP